MAMGRYDGEAVHFHTVRFETVFETALFRLQHINTAAVQLILYSLCTDPNESSMPSELPSVLAVILILRPLEV